MKLTKYIGLILAGIIATWATVGNCQNGKQNGGPVSASDQQAQATDLAGKRGDHKVDLFTGSFTYSIPISCAPARNGSEPHLALAYSSGGDNDWCGFGWKLDIGFIERNTKDGFPMKYSASVNGAPARSLNQYDDSKGFILNIFGKEVKLLPSGTGNEFRPEVDTDFFRCVFDAVNNKWTVYDTSGNVYYFGSTADGSSRVYNHNPGWPASGQYASTATFHWALDKIDTATGDETTIAYATYNDPNNSSIPERTIYPTLITYNNNYLAGSFNNTHTIAFATEDRTFSSGAWGNDHRFSYRWGFRTEQNRRLTTITCKVGSQYVSRYQLSYTPSPATGRSMLHTVTVYGADNTTALPVQTFTYQGASGVAFSPAFHWTGLNLNTPGAGTYEPYLAQVNKANGFTYTVSDIIDIDGDGLPDQVAYDDSVTPNRYRVQKNQWGSGSGSFGSDYYFGPTSTGNGTTPAANNPLPDGNPTVGPSAWAELNTPNGRVRDINGDGLPDRVMDYWKPWNTDGSLSGTPFTNLQVTLNTGNGFAAPTPWAVTNPVSDFDANQAYLYYWCVESGGINTGFYDIDGDGRPDRVMSNYGANGYPWMTNLFIQFNTGSNLTGMKMFGMYKSQNLYLNGANLANPGEWAGIQTLDSTMMDINGDGLPDHLMFPMNPSSGGNDLPHPATYFSVEYDDGYSFEALDTTPSYGGFADHWPGVGYQGTGTGTLYFSSVYGNRTCYSDSIFELPYSGLYDVNGDGLPDRVVVEQSTLNTGHTAWLVYLNNGTGFNAPIEVTGIENQSHDNTSSDYDWWSPQGYSQYGSMITTMVDINGDGLLDRVMAEYNDVHNAENGLTPPNSYFLVQTNMGPFPDLLTNIDNGMGGIIGMSYVPSTVWDNRTDPTVANSGSRMPFPRYTVAAVTESDGVNPPRKTSYSYAGGFFDGSRREFAGFAVVTNIDPTLRKTITYFHTGGGRNYASLGEYNDVDPVSKGGNFAKRGMAYRIETYGNDSPNPLLYKMEVNQVDQLSFSYTDGNNNTYLRYFPFVSQSFEYDYPGGGAPRVTGAKFIYSQYDTTPTYNLTQKILWGEVSASSINLLAIATPTLLDSPVDTQYHWIGYATVSGNSNIKDHPSSEKLTSDSNGNTVVQQTTYTYSPTTGTMLTKNEQICSGTFATTTYSGYNSYGLPTLKTDPVGVVTEVSYESSYNIYPATTRIRVTPGGDSGNDLITTTSYDVRSGRLTESVDPTGVKVDNIYNDPFFRLTESDKTPVGGSAVWMKKESYNFGVISSGNAASYDDVQVNDGVGGVESRTYIDGFGRTIQTRTQGEAGNFRVVSTAYDGRGMAFLTTWPRFESSVSFSKPTAQPASFIGYDPVGRVNVTYRRVDATFDGNGAFTGDSVNTGDSGSPLAATQWAYVNGTDPWWKISTDEDLRVRRYQLDSFGRTKVIQEVNGGSTYNTTMTCDLAGNLTQINNQNNENIYYGYDQLGNKVAMADPYLGQWTYQHDSAGRLRVQTDARGDIVTNCYINPTTHQQDPLGRVQLKVVFKSLADYNAQNPSSIVTYTYDSSDDGSYTVYSGLLYKITDSEGWEKNGYDTRGRLTKTTRHLNINNQDYTTTYAYNDGDKVTSIGYPNSGPTINYLYYTGGSIQQVQNNASFSGNVYYAVSASAYDEFGHVTSFTYGNGVGTTRNYYSNSKRLQSISSSSVLSRNYQYTGGDDVTSISGTGISGTMNVSYDNLHRIIAYSGLSGSYSYDAVGSIQHSIEGGGSDYSYGNSRKQAVKGAFGMTYLYDLCGNMIVRHGGSSGSQAMAYDPENRLSVFSQAGTIVVEYGYAEDGTRLWKRSNQDPAQVQLWIGKIYEEKNGTETPPVKHTLFHVFAGDQQVCTFEAGSPLAGGSDTTKVGYYYHEDNLNSSSALSSSSGSQQEVNVYYPFGRTQTQTDSSQANFQVSRRFTGQILDAETGLYYYNARYYDPELGRFIQPDPVIQDLANPQSFNRYSYCINNPLRLTDPTGLDYWGDVGGMFMGYYDAGASLVTGVGTMVVHPVNTVVGIGTAVAHPVNTVGAIATGVEHDWNSGARGQGRVVGSVLLAVASAVAPGAEAGNLGKVNEVANAGEKVEELTDSSLVRSGSCFAAGTLVQTPNGYTPIEDIQEGDTVFAYGFSDNSVVERKVLGTINHITDYWVLVGINGEELKATRGHLFWVESVNNWVPALNLRPGMAVKLSNGKIVAIDSVKLIELQNSEETYNLIVETDHDYFVGQNSILVHNGNDDVTRITYTAPELDAQGKPTGRTYNGMATGTGTPQKVLDSRFSRTNHHPGQNLGDPEIDDVHDTRAQQRGREQMLHEESGVNSANKRNPVGPGNPKKELYNKAVQEKYGYRLKC